MICRIQGRVLGLLACGPLLASLLLALPTSSNAATPYVIQDLGTLGGKVSSASSIGPSGQVVGYATLKGDSVTHAFLYNGLAMNDLGSLGGRNSYAFGVNRSGRVVGATEVDNAGHRHAFMWEHGRMTDLGGLGGTNSTALGVNDMGQIVGRSDMAGKPDEHAFLLVNGVMLDLGVLAGSSNPSYSGAAAINNAGQVAGVSSAQGTDRHAFIYSLFKMSDPGRLGGSQAISNGINDRGVTVGYSFLADGRAFHPFKCDQGVVTDLGTLGGRRASAQAINRFDQIVGFSEVTLDGAIHAFLYSQGKMVDLNSLLPVGSGWEINEAADINDQGAIVGTGVIWGETHAYILRPATQTGVDSPAPEPLALHAFPSVTHGPSRFDFGRPLDSPARLAVFDVSGRVLRDLPVERGQHSLAFDGRDSHGSPIASGVYIVRLDGPAAALTTRMVVVR